MRFALLFLTLLLLAGCGDNGSGGGGGALPPSVLPEGPVGRADITGVVGGINQKNFAFIYQKETLEVQVFLEGQKQTVFLHNREPAGFAELGEGMTVRVIGQKNPDKILADTIILK